MDLILFVINVNSSIKEALYKIENNHKGFILLSNDSERIVGISTDGDIRRKLMEGVSIEDSIALCANYNFIKAKFDTPRELLLKQLDHKIKAIPILDDNDCLVSIVSKDYFPEKKEQKVFARAKSPVRISFGGGGSDISSYFSENKAAVINATISLYSHATLKIRDDENIHISSLDLNDFIEFESIDQLNSYEGKFSLIVSVIKAVNPCFGFELFLY
jgi:D-glycero-alpha-D-manno-heptose-7-phosphate kinase